MALKKLAGALIAVGLRTVAFGTHAQMSGDKMKIGHIMGLSGLYADVDGQDGVEAVKMAIEDAGGKVLGRPIELVAADHQNKTDIATSKAREWTDQQGLDMLLGSMNSATGLAMNKVISGRKHVLVNIGAGTARLTNRECTPYTIHYAYDTVALVRGTDSAMIKQGDKSWFFLTADYVFGRSLKNDITAVIKANDSTVVGSVKHPLSASDFSSYLLQAQSSKARIPGLANAGDDTINSTKVAKEFGTTKAMKIVGLLMFINDMHSLGLQTAGGLLMTDSWYWDMNDTSRKFVSRYFMKMERMPGGLQAADCSAVSNYIKAVAATGTDDPGKVIAQLKKTKINGFYTKGCIRQDNRTIHDMYLLQVKTPAESKRPWDYLKVIATIPGEQAFTMPAKPKCSLMKK